MEKRNTKIKVDNKNKAVLVEINTKIYPLPIIYQAADVFIDRAYVFLDGDPRRKVNVIIKPMDGNANLKTIAGEFNNELVNYSAYFVRRQMNKELIEAMMRRAFQTTSEKGEEFEKMIEGEKKIDLGTKVPLVGETKESKAKDVETSKLSEKFDIKEIAKPWDKQKGAIKKEPRNYGKD